MVDPNDNFIIRKETMIVKNHRNIDEVYQRDASVSHDSSLGLIG